MINIIYKDKDIIAVEKPFGVPTQKDKSFDMDLLTLTSDLLNDMGENNSLWLVHRLDRVVGGVIVFARNKNAAAKLSGLMQENKVQKKYYAVVEGEVSEEGRLENYIYKDAAKNKAFIVDKERKGVKRAELIYKRVSQKNTDSGICSLIDIMLLTGRFHQIRAQFSHIKNPLVGDGKYGSHNNKCSVALYSYSITFTINKKEYNIKSYPNKKIYPWNLFEAEIL